MSSPSDESMVHGSKAALRKLPSVDALLRHAAVVPLLEQHGHTLVAAQARGLITEWRERLLVAIARDSTGRARLPVPAAEALPLTETLPPAGPLPLTAPTLPDLTDSLRQRCDARVAPTMRRVLNLTGTVIHTNLGRAVLSEAVMAEASALMTAPNNLEFDLDSGGRGDRDSLVESLLCELTGAQAATVVNNNAAAVLLTVAALARGREVIVSRGELVEIGGAFRMPDVMASAGATLVEVGTTNRTHPADYQRAIGSNTALLMKVHTSNYAISGFTASVAEAQLASIAHAAGLPLATDLGSGALVDLATYGLPAEPLPQQALIDGCDVVTFSGDKLLGGPQAGLIVGSRDVVQRIRKFPMKRALRMSKLPMAVLAATLRLYLSPETLAQRLPTLRVLTRPTAAIDAMARALQPRLAQAVGEHFKVDVVAMNSQIGSGSLPLERLPSAGFHITTSQAKPSPGHTLEQLATRLRGLPMPVIGRINDNALKLDLRCLEDPRDLLDQLPLLSSSSSSTAAPGDPPPHDPKAST